ncbi:unnamed protein product [Paramecium primaurelia]|uniref:Uncharacterized protein n=1 Tax=Paramecium primaurelia TaxID=5886 RepID=A0A8S1Q9H5_PARPR|nr:unnamed protein product [Paramecium primaurelia]
MFFTQGLGQIWKCERGLNQVEVCLFSYVLLRFSTFSFIQSVIFVCKIGSNWKCSAFRCKYSLKIESNLILYSLTSLGDLRKLSKNCQFAFGEKYLEFINVINKLIHQIFYYDKKFIQKATIQQDHSLYYQLVLQNVPAKQNNKIAIILICLKKDHQQQYNLK